MSAQARLAALQQRHAQVDEELRKIATRPAADEQREKELKREKLRLKDEIERLRP